MMMMMMMMDFFFHRTHVVSDSTSLLNGQFLAKPGQINGAISPPHQCFLPHTHIPQNHCNLINSATVFPQIVSGCVLRCPFRFDLFLYSRKKAKIWLRNGRSNHRAVILHVQLYMYMNVHNISMYIHFRLYINTLYKLYIILMHIKSISKYKIFAGVNDLIYIWWCSAFAIASQRVTIIV
jgi:hypothetical protein